MRTKPCVFAVLGRAVGVWFLALGLANGSAWADVVDRVLASVDKEVILLSDVMMELGPYIPDIRAAASNEEEYNRLLDQRVRATLEQAIDNKILLRQALLAGLEVKDDVVERHIEDLKKTEGFQEYLEASGETLSELRARLRKNLLARKVAYDKTQEFAKTVVVSEADVAQYYQDHKSEFERPERLRVRQIFLSAPAAPRERAVARARLEQLIEELQAGADFASLAQVHSMAPGAEDGGIIGWVTRGDLDRRLEDAVFGLPEGGVSDVIESEYGMHLVKVDRREEAGLTGLEEVRREIEPILRAQEAAQRYQKWIADLRNRSQVRVFLR